MFWDGVAPGAAYFDDWEVEYLYVGKEICPESKREHYQGYVRFGNARALGGVTKLFIHKLKLPSGRPGYPGHWEACKGTEAQNVKYCAKEDDLVIEFGESETDLAPDKHQGKRNDIIAVRNMIIDGARMRDVVLHSASYQGIKIAETMLKYIEPSRSWKPEVYWIYGPTGVFKTRYASEACADPWISGIDGKWFEGYDAHEDVIFDDFREDFCKFHILLRLLDRYPYRVEVKGASRQFLAKRIFITSCHPPESTFRGAPEEDILQLGRRIDHVVYMPTAGVAYSRPGSVIGLEPSVRFVFPALRPAQKVWGNTTDAPHPTEAERPALTGPQTGLICDTKCFEPHGPDFVCDDCENDCSYPEPSESGDHARSLDEQWICPCGFSESECSIVCLEEACPCFMEKPIKEEAPQLPLSLPPPLIIPQSPIPGRPPAIIYTRPRRAI